MIHLISRNIGLFKSEHYESTPFKSAMDYLWKLKKVQFDTETEGLDPHTKKLLTVQLGNKQEQYVFDWQTLTSEEKAELKRYLESGVVLIGWNLIFDLGFMYVQDIWPANVWDGMIAEQLIFLGYSHEEHSYSLQSAARFYLDYDLDKSVRGKIINVGLTEEVVVYAAGDVMWLEDIQEKQLMLIEREELENALALENAFLPVLAYFKHCGVKLDVPKWRKRMKVQEDIIKDRISDLNTTVENWVAQHPEMRYDIKYVDTFDKSEADVAEEMAALIKKKYTRFPKQDAIGPKMKLIAFRKPYDFVAYNLQGDLFSDTPYDDKPHCAINWNSQEKIIQFFNLLGVKTKTFDKKTKKEKDSLEKEVLKPQANSFPIVKQYLEYKKAVKQYSTYGQNWIDAINPKTGRIHAELHAIGTTTARVSSGGGVYKLNLQNLPHDAETRACFIAEKGNKWLSADYQSQESRIIASVSEDKAMLDVFNSGCGDVHSLVAYMSYPDIIPRETRIEDINHLYHEQRQDAKGIEFAINYGGDANTIANNKNIPLRKAQEIYDNFMKGFPGVKTYQDYARKAVMRDGYILMNPQTRHRCHIPNWDSLKYIQSKMNGDDEFWNHYNHLKNTNPNSDTVLKVKQYYKDKIDWEKNSINYRIQNRGACMFKLAMIKFFNWIKRNNYLNVVLLCVPAHDECNCECPENIAEIVGAELTADMAKAGAAFCKNITLGADININDYWVH